MGYQYDQVVSFLELILFIFFMFYADYQHSGVTGTRKEGRTEEKLQGQSDIYRDLLTFSLINSLREYLMNYEYIKSLLISYVHYGCAGKGVVISIVKAVVVTEKPC